MTEECRKGGYRERVPPRGVRRRVRGSEQNQGCECEGGHRRRRIGQDVRWQGSRSLCDSEEEREEAAEGPLEQKIGLYDGLLPVCLLSGESALALR